MEWNNDVVRYLQFPFVREALALQKYAFVADFVRVYAVSRYGGVYIDADVEIVDSFMFALKNRFFIGIEKYQHWDYTLGAHLFGAIANHTIVTDLFHVYEGMHFIYENGTLNRKVIPNRFQEVLSRRYNLPPLQNISCPYEIADQAVLYPVWFFCNAMPGKHSYAIHMFSGTWINNLQPVSPTLRSSEQLPISRIHKNVDSYFGRKGRERLYSNGKFGLMVLAGMILISLKWGKPILPAGRLHLGAMPSFTC